MSASVPAKGPVIRAGGDAQPIALALGITSRKSCNAGADAHCDAALQQRVPRGAPAPEVKEQSGSRSPAAATNDAITHPGAQMLILGLRLPTKRVRACMSDVSCRLGPGVLTPRIRLALACGGGLQSLCFHMPCDKRPIRLMKNYLVDDRALAR
jgi:hypothetical protein